MNPQAQERFREIVHELFIRWDALKIAVEHQGGQSGQQTAREIRDYIFNYCTQNENIHSSELDDLLNDIMDEEFNTICEDNSVNELSVYLVEYLNLCHSGHFEEINQRLSTLPKCINWLDPSFKIIPAPNADDSDSDSDSDEEMDVSSEDETPAQVNTNQIARRSKPQVDEDGWTTIPSRRRN